MTETIGILVVFFILILFGVIFYAQYQKSAIREQQDIATGKRAVATSLKAFYLPELRCTKGFDEAFIACVDIHKLNIFQNKINENYNFYANIFGKSYISLYNVIENNTIEIYNGTPSVWTKKIPIRFPVLIYDAIEPGTCKDVSGRCDFSVLSVDIYE